MSQPKSKEEYGLQGADVALEDGFPQLEACLGFKRVELIGAEGDLRADVGEEKAIVFLDELKGVERASILCGEVVDELYFLLQSQHD